MLYENNMTPNSRSGVHYDSVDITTIIVILPHSLCLFGYRLQAVMHPLWYVANMNMTRAYAMTAAGWLYGSIYVIIILVYNLNTDVKFLRMPYSYMPFVLFVVTAQVILPGGGRP